MDVHPILLVNGRSDVVLEVIGGDPDMNAARDFKGFPCLGSHIALPLGVAGDGLRLGPRIGGLSGRG